MKPAFSILLALFLFAPLDVAANDGTEGLAPLPCDAAQGESCYKHALALHNGTDIPKDKTTAHRIFTQLCEADMSKACHAANFEVGRFSATPDFEKSLYFQTKGCDLGTARSCYVMGRNWEAPWGDGVEADHEKAREFFTRGCDLGMGLACGQARVKASGQRLKR